MRRRLSVTYEQRSEPNEHRMHWINGKGGGLQALHHVSDSFHMYHPTGLQHWSHNLRIHALAARSTFSRQ